VRLGVYAADVKSSPLCELRVSTSENQRLGLEVDRKVDRKSSLQTLRG
jgi:hypothetical protein